MASITDLQARDSDAAKRARSVIESRIQLRESEQNDILSKMMADVITDKLVYPLALQYGLQGTQFGVQFIKGPEDPGEFHTIHSHALGQMADISGMTRVFLRRLHDHDERWGQELLAYNLNTLFGNTKFVDRQGRPKRFLVRSVRGHVRGFLSQNFNRKLTTPPLLRAFIESGRALGAGPVQTTATDVRIRVQYMLPYVFEPVGGEFVAFGAAFGNSDFGAGRLSVTGLIMRVMSETVTLMTDSYSRTHIGSMITDSDLEPSEETSDKELGAAVGYVRDAVTSLMGPESIERSLKAIQVAHTKEIPWYQLKNRLADLLSKDEVGWLDEVVHGKAAVVDLPPVDLASSDDGDSPSAWWAANAVSTFASKALDPDKKAALQKFAGQLMSTRSGKAAT